MTEVLDSPIPETLPGTAPLLLNGPHPTDPALQDWFAAQQNAAWQEFEGLPMPVRTDEAWRFSQIKALDLTSYFAPQRPDAEKADELIALSDSAEAHAGRMVFGNGFNLSHAKIAESLQSKGVVFCPLDEAVQTHANLVQQYFMTQSVRLGSEKFAALHKSILASGTFLFVPKGVEVELPLEVFHWIDGANASVFPHTLIVAEPQSKVTLIESFRSTDSHHAGFACGVNDLHIGEGANVTYICSQQWNEEVLAIQINSTVVEKDGAVTSLNLNLGGAYARVESRSRMAGTGSRSDMLAVTVADRTQRFDLRTAQDHGARGTTSDLLYKNALDDQSQAIFSGIIRVEKGAHQTDAYQTNRSLVLSDEAESDSMPGLEILADDVKCSHGSTTGNISDEEMFYLKARGISEIAAKRLMVNGFLNEVFQRLPDASLAARLLAQVEDKFAAIHQRHREEA